jgi:hypothetical protein
VGIFLKLYSNKLKNEEEMDQFLDTYDSLKLNQEVIKNVDRYIASDEIETVIKYLSTKKNPGPD